MNKNQESGFIKIIVIIVIGLLLMKYFNVSAADILNWLKTFIISVYDKIK